MKVKKYQAQKMTDAMQKIKKELGPEAIILQSKAIKKGGIFGLFQKNYVEVIAALDNDVDVHKERIQQPIISPKDRMSSRPHQTVNDEVLGEIKQLKKLISMKQMTNDPLFPAPYEYAYQYLKTQEIDPVIAERWVKEIWNGDDECDETIDDVKGLLQEKIENEIENVLQTGNDKANQIIQFVGPTGVGKTTTLAKVAAKYMLEKEKNVAFITLDTYRIAAVEQLKTYASILNVPIEVAYSLQDYKKALQKFSQYDTIFVDTPGRNYREAQYMMELKDLTNIQYQYVSTYLVLSLTAKTNDILEIYEQFNAIPIEKVILTKLDETTTFGSMINILIQENKPIQYMTNGQDVPDDLLLPTGPLITRYVLRNYEDV